MKKTKIVATIGPASISKKILKKMYEAGMDAIRINTSHGNRAQYEEIINNMRAVGDGAIILDTKGPEIRINSEQEHVVSKGDIIKIGFSKSDKISFDRNFKTKIKKNQFIMVDDGLLRLKVVSVGASLSLKSLSNGVIADKSRVNIPSSNLNFPLLSKEDKDNLKYGLKKGVDYVAVSYTSSASDVKKVKKIVGDKIGIIAKIENSLGVKNIDEIIQEAEGIMVARGDLGVEIDSEKLPLIQKKIIRKCNSVGKLVITATQMLQSMINNSSPTRAETSDVANAILDGTDCIMLSGETTIGGFPVLAVKEMTRIAKEVEPSVRSFVKIDSNISISEAISMSIYEITKVLPITKIVTLTKTGYTARIISRFRLINNIIAITPSESVKRRMNLYYGVIPVVFEEMPARERIMKSTRYLYKKNLLNKKDLVLYTAGVLSKEHGSTNLIEIHNVNDLLNKKF